MRDTHPLSAKGEFDCRSLVKQECEEKQDRDHDVLFEAAYGKREPRFDNE